MVFCINMHCHNQCDMSIPGNDFGDYFCCENCKLEDRLREEAGLNDDKWQTRTHIENGELVIDG